MPEEKAELASLVTQLEAKSPHELFVVTIPALEEFSVEEDANLLSLF